MEATAVQTLPVALRALVEALPEVYQPIYGYEQLSSSRTSTSPRMRALLDTVELLSKALGRKLRILDLGSAQGYAAFCLAAHGHHVTGIEFLDLNVAVAEAIAVEHEDHDVSFVLGDVSDAESLVDIASYDVVVALSVFHHLIYRDGHDSVTALIGRLSALVPHAFFELALAEEPLYWAEALPKAPRSTIASYGYARQLVLSATHLSEVQRPLFFCSQRYALAHGELLPFLGWSAKSHAQGIDVQSMAMRYYTIDGGISKVAARLNDALPPVIFDSLREDLRREAHVLEALERAGIEAPKLIDFVDGPEEVVLTRSAYPGDLVSDLLGSLTAQERRVVTSDVLDQLASLEAHGLYHSDLRLWNVVLDREGKRAYLIDHGSIRSTPTDVVQPNDAYLSLAIFLASLWSSRADQTGEHLPRSLAIDAADLPAHVVGVITSILVAPRDGKVFSSCQRQWRALLSNENETLWPPIPVSWGWLRASYAQIAALNTELTAAQADISTLRWRLEADRDYWRTARHEADLAIEKQGEAIASLQADRDVISQNRQLVIDELAATKLTLSWRITARIRSMRRLVPRR